MQLVDGINFNNRVAYVCPNPEEYADDTTTNYTSIGITLPSNEIITKLGHSTQYPWALVPSASGYSESSYVPDYVQGDTGWRILLVGGYWSNRSIVGVLFFNGYCTSKITTSSVGVRLLHAP